MTPEQAETLGAFIAESREAAGYSQRRLAEHIDVSNTTIMRLEAGHYTAPSPEILSRIAETLGLELADLFAMADYVVPENLPTMTLYLRSKYRDLPDDVAEEIQAYAQRIAKRHGVDMSGPAPGEDEGEPELASPKRGTRSKKSDPPTRTTKSTKSTKKKGGTS